MIRSFEGHTSSAYSVAITPDGKHIVSGSWDKTIKLWDINSGKEIRSFEGHTNSVNSVTITPDGKHIVSGGYDITIKLWNINSGEALRSFKGNIDSVYSVAFTPDGKSIIFGGEGSIKLWKQKNDQMIQSFEGHRGAFYAVAYSPNGKFIISGGKDKTIRLWDINGGKVLLISDGHNSPVDSLALVPMENILSFHVYMSILNSGIFKVVKRYEVLGMTTPTP